MTSPHNMSNTPMSQQIVQIVSVDPIAMTAVGYTRQKSMISINIQYHVGAVHVIPCVGEQWILKKVSANWGLERKLPKNDNTLANVADNPVPGLTQIGSSGAGAGPTILEGSQTTVNSNRLQLGDTTLYRDNDGTLENSTDGGTTWNQIQGGSGGGDGGPVAWADITGKPTEFPTAWDEVDNIPDTFPTAWSLISGKPSIFPSDWTSVSGKPTLFPPIPPTGTPDGTKFWRDDDTWATPTGGGGNSGALIVGAVPTGLINGTNTVFTTSQPFQPGTAMVYLNGLRQRVSADYTETSTTTVALTTAPHAGDVITMDYLEPSISSGLVVGEVPTGTLNGANATFTVTSPFVASSTSVFRNGLREVLGVGYTESGGNALVFSSPPLSNDLLAVDYLATA